MQIVSVAIVVTEKMDFKSETEKTMKDFYSHIYILHIFL